MYPIKFQITNDSKSDFQQLDWNSKIAVAGSFERAQYFELQYNFDLYSFTHPNNIYDYPTKLLWRPLFPYANELNTYIKRAVDGGLINKWQKSYRPSMNRKTENQIMYLKFENFIPIFIIWVGVVLVLFSFLMIERIVYRKAQKQGSRQFWRYTEVMIDPERHFLLKKYI